MKVSYTKGVLDLSHKSFSKLVLFFVLISIFSLTSIASSPELIFTNGVWTKEGNAVIGHISDDVDFSSAYFNTPFDSFYFEADVTFLDVVNYSRWFGISYRSNDDKTISHMLRIKQKSSLRNGIELTFLEDDRWQNQMRFAGTEFLEIGQKHKVKLLSSKDYLFAYLDDELLIASKFPLKVANGYLGIHTNGATVKFENIVVKEYPKEEMMALETQAEWHFGRQRALQFPAVPFIVAHRGNSSEAPENTLAAVRSAILAGADGVEIDVYSTLDGDIILSHDPTVNRCTNGKGNVQYSTTEYLRSLDAGYPDKFGNKFAGEKMPFLREVLEEIKDKVILVIEIKQYGIEDKIIELLNETGTRNQVVIISFNANSLARVHDLAPDIPTSLLASSPNDPEGLIALAKTAKTRSLDLAYGLCTREVTSYLISRGYSVWAWTVDDTRTMQNLVNDGVSVITTNVPSKALDTFRPLD